MILDAGYGDNVAVEVIAGGPFVLSDSPADGLEPTVPDSDAGV